MVFGCKSIYSTFVKKHPLDESRMCVVLMNMCFSTIKSISKLRLT